MMRLTANWRRGAIWPALWLVFGLPFALPAQVGSLTVVTYNMLNFSNNSSSNARIEHFKMVLSELAPDILVAQEVASQAGADLILSDILQTFSLEYEAGEFFDEGSHNNAVFYRRDRVGIDSIIAINTDLRDINGYVFSINDHADPAFRWTLFATHLKAGNPVFDANDAHRRWLEVARLQSYIASQDSNYHYGFAGDFNVYTAAEAAYTLLMDSMAITLVDPIDDRGAWHNNSAYAGIHTQSTCVNQTGCVGSNGGMDDRFDFILLSHQMIGGQFPLTYVEGSYEAYGNDGQHFNKNITDNPQNQGIPNGMADALFGASDHLPVILQLSYPATGNTVDILAYGERLPNRPQLLGNYPNPFNPTSTIRFDLPEAVNLELAIYNLRGRTIVRLIDGQLPAGNHRAVWDGRDRFGRQVPSGIYIARLVTPGFTKSIKMILLK